MFTLLGDLSEIRLGTTDYQASMLKPLLDIYVEFAVFRMYVEYIISMMYLGYTISRMYHDTVFR